MFIESTHQVFICSQSTTETPGKGHWRCFVVFIVNFEQSSHFYGFCIIDIDQVNARWEETNNQDSNKLACNAKRCMLS